MSAAIDMRGQRYGRLIVLRRVGRHSNGGVLWLCRCNCGRRIEASRHDLRIGDSKSCGCYRRERLRRHGEAGHAYSRATKEYRSWKALRQRCRNPHNKQFHDYGGRGITVCPEWNDFQIFLRDMGRAPSRRHSIDRIDNNGPYTGPCADYPDGNCRWATAKEQAQNARPRRRHARSSSRA